MAYVRTAWVDRAPPGITAAQLNRMEDGIFNAVRGRTEDALRVVRGRFSPGTPPTVSEGTGWTVARNGIGDYTVTFTTAFSGAPSVAITTHYGGGAVIGNIPAVAAGSFRVVTFQSNTGTNTDSNVMFVAVGPA